MRWRICLNVSLRLVRVELTPLLMTAGRANGETHSAVAINEVSLLRQTNQAAHLRILVNGRERVPRLVADGASGGDSGRLDGLQPVGSRTDTSAGYRCDRTDSDQSVSTSPLARCDPSRIGNGKIRG